MVVHISEGGVPHLADGGYPPSQVRMGLPDPRSGLGGTSCPGQNKGTPSQVRTEVRGTLGYPNIGTGWGTPVGNGWVAPSNQD